MKLPSLFEKFDPAIKWINDRTIYVTKHGSQSYGTNIEGSDTDVKGICIPPKEYYLGFLKKFEQAELHDPDAVIFELTKFFKLAADSNPNCLEILFIDPSDILYIDDLGQLILDNRDLFLSKKVKYTMTGYAISQLKKIKLHKQYLLNPPKCCPTRMSMGLPEKTLIPQDQLMAAQAEINKELDKLQFDLNDLSESSKIEIKNNISNMLAGLKITADDQWMAAARTVGLSDNFIQNMQREGMYANLKRQWDQYQIWKKNRNPARAALEEKYMYDTKFGYHLVRLTRMCKEILTTGKVLVKRPDREELIAIRNGLWSYDQLLEFVEEANKELDIIYDTCNVLPNIPDRNKLDNLCVQLIEKSLS